MPEDARAIAAVLSEAFVEYKSLYMLEGCAATTPGSAQVQRRLEEGPVWVALHNDVIVGTVSVIPKEEELYIRGMAVLPESRGQRIGGLLLKQIEVFASEHGCKRLTLRTTPFLDSAFGLYEHYGFRRISEGPDNLFGTQLFTMEKILKA